MWSRNIALDVCKEVEALCPKYGCHVALTGGVLYKDGPRKDLDLLFYRIRQVTQIDEQGLLLCLSQNGFTMGDRFGWVQKARYWDMDIDMFFPEEQISKDNKWASSYWTKTSTGAHYVTSNPCSEIPLDF